MTPKWRVRFLLNIAARAGKKGIGRFATKRLGRGLTIVTQTEAEDHGLSVTVDWNVFTQGEDINLIANSISEGAKEQPHGTRLSIEKLNDSWTDSDLRRVYMRCIKADPNLTRA